MTEQWKELKETIVELRDGDGTGTQQEVCKFLVNYMEVLEKQMQEPSDDAISRQAVLNALYELCDTGETLKENPWRDNPHIDAVIETIEELPPVTPQPKMGRWIYGEDNLGTGRDGWYCNQCGHFEFWDYSSDMKSAKLNLPNFCPNPNCGAKMQELEE